MITGLTRIRNEAAIIQDTLDHMDGFCHKIYVYDDASDDGTVDIVKRHPAVSGMIEGKWASERPMAETNDRRELLSLARKMSPDTDWFVYMDADERIEFDWGMLDALRANITGVRMKLFDFYITPHDVDRPYSERRFMGPEYRNIMMVFRNIPQLIYKNPIQRSPILPGEIIFSGYVKHYGKALTVAGWEKKCDYYMQHFPKRYSEKWKARKGKAVHTESDFGRPLITWEEKELKGIKLY